MAAAARVAAATASALEKDVIEASVMTTSQCYCGRTRHLLSLELICASCRRWFHSECVNIYTGTWLPFTLNYLFHCRNCSTSGVETLARRPPTYIQLCQTAIANLTLKCERSAGKPNGGEHSLVSQSSLTHPGARSNASVQGPMHSGLFSKTTEILPWIDRHWDQLVGGSLKKNKNQWQDAAGKALHREHKVFSYQEEVRDDPHFGVVDPLYMLAPCIDTYLADTASKSKTSGLASGAAGASGTDSGTHPGSKRKLKHSASTSNDTGDSASSFTRRAGRHRGGADAANRLTNADDHTNEGGPSLMGSGPQEYPFNKDGYNYYLAEPDPLSPWRTVWDQSSATAGKAIPGCLYRGCISGATTLSLHDRAPQLKLLDDRLTVTGDKGYCLIRSNHSVGFGTWYFEVDILELPDNSAARVGFCGDSSNLQAPCGYDKFGYAIRTKFGTVFHQSRGKHYMDSGFEAGDTIGCLIDLPFPESHHESVVDLRPPDLKSFPLIRFKGNLYYEGKENLVLAEKMLKPASDSCIRFFKNGVSPAQAPAFKEISRQLYFVGISLYKGSKVKVNFGPDFKFAPKDVSFQPFCDAGSQMSVLHTVCDLAYHVQHEGKPPSEVTAAIL